MGITREIILYSNTPFKKYRWISYVTIGQLSFMVLNLFVIPTPKLMAERDARKAAIDSGSKSQQTGEFTGEGSTRNQDNNSSSLKQGLGKLDYREIFSIDNIVNNLIGRPYFSGGLILASSLITLGLFYRARRSIHMITLLPNDKVKISTFSPIALGRPPTVELPLSHVSCQQPRNVDTNYTMLKLKGHLGLHLIDKSEGQFHEPQLFDQHLGFARSWAASRR